MSTKLVMQYLWVVSLLVIPVTGCGTYCGSQTEHETGVYGVPPQRGCRVYSPASDPLAEVPIRVNSKTETEGGIEVTASVLSDEQSRKVFGVNLARYGIQPLWIEIHNTNNYPVRVLHVSVDPGYFSPNEASYMNYRPASPVNEIINRYFDENALEREVAPGGELSGFIHTTWDPGVKYVNVTVYGDHIDENFVFYFEIPGLRTDYQRVDFDNLYNEDEIADYETEVELRAALEGLTCCTSRRDGSGQNDPLNFIIIGDRPDVFSAFIRRGWDVTETINVGSGWRSFKAFFSHKRYRTSPMSSLFFMNRPQDIGLQKARSTIHERNHLRMWLLPMRYKGKEVWIGAISRDVGSYITLKTPWLTAHAIDPNLDEARKYLEQDMMFSGGVVKLGYISGVPVSSRAEPERNFMDQPWWSDGMRAVLVFGDDAVPVTKITLFDWEWPGEGGEEIIRYIRKMKKNKTNKQ